MIFKTLKELSNIGQVINSIGSVDNNSVSFVNDLAKATEGLSVKNTILALSTKGVTKEQAELVFEARKVRKEEYEQIIANASLSTSQIATTGATFSLSAAFKGLTASIWANIKAMLKWLVSNPIGQISLVIGAMAVLVAIYNALTTSLSEAQDNLEDSISAFNETTEEINSLNEELKTTEDRIKELQKLSDTGTISVADEAELKTLKEQNKELARQIALKQRQQITEGERVLEDAKKVSSKTVKSQYEFVVQNQKEGTTTGAQVSVKRELLLAMDAYKEAQKEVEKWNEELDKDYLSDSEREKAEVNLKIQKEILANTEARIDEMYGILDAERQAYLDLNEAGYSLSAEDKNELDLLNEYNDIYLKWNHSLTQTKQSFESLNAEQQRSILLNRLLEKNIPDEYAKAIIDAISDADLSEYWDKDFSFIPPQMTDYSSAKEYGEAYAKAWLEGLQTEIKSAPEIDVLTITETVDNINSKLKPALDSLAGIYTTLFNEDGDYEWQIIDVEEFASIKSELDSLKEEFGINVPTEAYEEFVKILSDTSTNADQAQQAFDDLATSMINNSNVVELTEENFNVLRNSLESLGVTNANEVLEKMKRIKDELTLASIDLENVTYEEASAFINSKEASIEATEYLKSYMLEKYHSNKNTLNTLEDVKALEEECEALNITGQYLKAVLHLKTLYESAKHGGIGTELQDEIRAAKAELDNLYNNQYKYKVEFDYDGNTAGKTKDDLSSSAKDTKETFDWIETLISRIQRNITNLGKIVSATYRNWSIRNNALAQEMAEVNKEINAQMSAYNAYMAEAEKVGLDDYHKKLIQSGAYNIEVSGNEALNEKISLYKEWYEKALNASDAIEDLRANLADLAMTKFDNVAKQYDDQIASVTHYVDMLEGFVSQSEAAGYMASEAYYQAMAEKQQANIDMLKSEYSSLLSAFDEAVKSGSIEKYSEDWYTMYNNINDVEKSLQDATTQLIEFNQTLQQLNWEVFDRVQGYVSNIVTESEALIDILDAYKLHTSNGVITDEGLAVQGLHAVNYNVYMEQALAYAKEMREIEAEMANDPYDMELVDRRNELLGLQQEAISNAMSEKEAIHQLISDGYDKMLESLNELIDKRKEALQAEKDLYDYQNTISEKTSNISSLQKQLQAYAGDNSESAKATIQKLQVSLAEAEKDLQETEYERYLSDQEQMLDTLYDQTEQWVNERLDNLDGLVAEAIEATNANAETISNAIHEAANAYGYKLSDQMETIWDYEANAIDGVVTIVSVYGDILHGTGKDLLNSNTGIANAITGGTTNVITAINGLNSSMQTIIGKLTEIATANANSIAQAQNAVVNNQNNSYPTNNTPAPTTSNTGGSSSGGGTSGGGGTKNDIPKTPKGYYAYIGDEKVGHSQGFANEGMARYAAEVEVEKRAKAASNGISGSPGVQIYNNTKASLTRSIRTVPFYAKGTSNAPEGVGVWGENGTELMIAKDGSILLASGAQLYPFQGGEKVFNPQETSEILKNTVTPNNLDNIVKAPKLLNTGNGIGSNVTNDVQLNIAVKANNYDEFVASFKTAVKSDPQCRKLLQAVTIDETVGKGGLRRNNF